MHSPLCDGIIKMEVFTGPQSHMFLTLINTLFTSQALLSPKNLFPADFGPNLKDGDEFDFIVVGSGSAGSTVAYRLSEHQNWTVLLLEAGGYPSTATEIPLVFFDLVKTQDDWHYDLEPSNSACLGSRKQKCMYPRGKTLGGTSAINGMMYIHGHRKDFDTWEDKGNIGWGYDSMIKHIKKVEDVQVENSLFGKGGELKITQYRSPHPIRRALIRAYQEVGYGKYDQENPIGYFDSFTSIYKGTRVSAAKAFLAKEKNRKNLYVALNAQVGRVLVEGAYVTGVEVRLNGQILKIKLRKEVILSAGSINLPQILMNSGIGPKDHLRQLGIPVVKDLEVGQNLQDHIGFTGLFYNVADHALLPKTSDSVLDDWYQYFRQRTGPISQSGIQNFLSFLDTTRKSNYPTSEMYYIPLHKNDVYGGLKTYQRVFNLPDEVIRIQNENNRKFYNVILTQTIISPKSVGNVSLRSSDPFDTPKIFPNYFSDPNGEDIQVILDGIRFCQNLTRTKAFAAYQPKLVYLDIPNCRHLEVESEEYWKCGVRNIGTTAYHPVGTCKMGPREDPHAVVDPRLRVHGLKGIRVVDGSIMPKIISANPNSAIIGIGEKGASMISEDWTL